jgi:hypothetical protein
MEANTIGIRMRERVNVSQFLAIVSFMNTSLGIFSSG